MKTVGLLIVITLTGVCFCSSGYVNPDQIRFMAYAHSIINDRDLYFMNDFDAFGMVPLYYFTTPAEYVGNPSPIGSSILHTPALFLEKIESMLIRAPTSADNDGSRIPVKVSLVNFLVFFAGIATLWMCYALGKRIITNASAHFEPMIMLTFGTPFLFYLFLQPGLSHIPSAFAVSLLVAFWCYTRNQQSWQRWIILGVLCGFASMMRNQHVLFILLPLSEIAFNGSRPAGTVFRKLFLLGTGFVVAFSLQTAVWKILFGTLFSSMEAEVMRWNDPHVLQLLFSFYHGLFAWSPILLLSIAGLIHLAIANFRLGLPLLLIFIMQIFINASSYFWWQGASFGSRQFLGCFPIFYIGLIHFYNTFKSGIWKFTGWIFAAWSIILLIQVSAGPHNLGVYYPLQEILAMIPRSFLNLSQGLWDTLKPNHHLTPVFAIQSIVLISALYVLISWLRKPSWQPGNISVAVILCITVIIYVSLIVAAINGNKLLEHPEPRLIWLQENRPSDPYYGRVVVKNQYYGQIGMYYLKLGNMIEAEHAFRSACTLHPADFIARYNLAHLLVRLKRYGEALHELEIAKTIKPDDPDIINLLETVKTRMPLQRN